jgi:superfamily II DNA or RNA helicase
VIELRDYQEDALRTLRDRIRMGKRRPLLVAPTGAGKTTIAGAMIHGVMAKGRRAIFLAHRKELINQCAGRLTQFGVPHGVIKAKDKRRDPTRPVQVASVQTLTNREHWPADLIIVDEAHRSTSKTYVDILERYDNPIVVGLTATPYRMDGRGLGEIYDDIVEVCATQDLVDLGYLIRPSVFGSVQPVDLSGVSTSMGDFNKKELAGAMEGHVLRGEILTNWTRVVSAYMQKRGVTATKPADLDACTVVFASSVEQSIKIAEQFKAVGVPAAHIDGKTPDDERDEILAKLRSRELTVVSNFGLLTEGWDLPHLECVILARPTRSKSLYRQMVGRIMRPDDDKRFAIVLDHGNCTRMHGFATDPQEYTLDGREARPRKGSKPAPHKMCERCLAKLPMNSNACDICGHQKLKLPVEYTNEMLVELDASNVDAGAPRAHAVPRDERQRVFDRFCYQCIERGFKPNWARMRYMQTYGEWPTWQSGIRSSREFMKYEADVKKRREAEAGELRESLMKDRASGTA